MQGSFERCVSTNHSTVRGAASKAGALRDRPRRALGPDVGEAGEGPIRCQASRPAHGRWRAPDALRARTTQVQVRALVVLRVRAHGVIGSFGRLLVIPWLADQPLRSAARAAAAHASASLDQQETQHSRNTRCRRREWRRDAPHHAVEAGSECSSRTSNSTSVEFQGHRARAAGVVVPPGPFTPVAGRKLDHVVRLRGVGVVRGGDHVPARRAGIGRSRALRRLAVCVVTRSVAALEEFGCAPRARRRQLRISRTTRPDTSVRRKWRPWKNQVNRSWSRPSRCSSVACRSCTDIAPSTVL